MGFFDKIFSRKNNSDTAVNAPASTNTLDIHVPRYVENQNGRCEATLEIVEDMVQEMFADADQFVTLSLPAPIHDGVRFVQACLVPNGIDVQLGIGAGNQTKLVERLCTEDECIRIFRDFYDTAKVEDIECYTPVQLMRP